MSQQESCLSFEEKQTNRTPLDLSSSTLYEIDPSEVQLGFKIGSGSFGKVYSAVVRHCEVAVKIFDKKLSPEEILDFRREISFMSHIGHPNVLMYMGANTQKEPYFLVCEKMNKSVGALLESHVPLELSQRLSIIESAAKGMAWLHSCNPQILHRDLKAENLLLDNEWNVKICDFGLAQLKVSQEAIVDRRGTPCWMPPEAFQGEEISAKSDVYSFGITMWEVVTGMELFPDFVNVKRFKEDICIKNIRPPLLAQNIQKQKIPDEINQLMQKCWAPKPQDRPEFNSILPTISLSQINASLSDLRAAQFWFQTVAAKKVEWQLFCDSWLRFFPMEKQILAENGLLDDLSLSDSNNKSEEFNYQEMPFKCLRVLAAEKNETISRSEDCWIVTLSTFSKALRLLGPCTENCSLFHLAYELLKQPWFHGAISIEDAETLLQRQSKPCFLIRTSQSIASSPVTLSQLTINPPGLFHIRISTTDSGALRLPHKSPRTPRKTRPSTPSKKGSNQSDSSEGEPHSLEPEKAKEDLPVTLSKVDENTNTSNKNENTNTSNKNENTTNTSNKNENTTNTSNKNENTNTSNTTSKNDLSPLIETETKPIEPRFWTTISQGRRVTSKPFASLVEFISQLQTEPQKNSKNPNQQDHHALGEPCRGSKYDSWWGRARSGSYVEHEEEEVLSEEEEEEMTEAHHLQTLIDE